jgi:alpha-glucoside transport system substrate-binding protein
MTRQHLRGWRAGLALLIPLALIASACADDDDDDDASSDTTASDDGGGGGDYPDLEGEEITVFGPEVETEQESLDDAFTEFEEATGAEVTVSGARSFETDIGSQVEGGSPPDVAMFPQPGGVANFAEDIVTIPDDVASTVSENFDEGWTGLATIDGELKAIPAKADLKGVVYYSPATFEENGWEVPETLEDFEALAEEIAGSETAAFCMGTGSDDATGWPFTDWIEDYVLRLNGPEVYDQWINHEIPFNDPQIVETTQHVVDLLSADNAVLGGLENVASQPFADAGLPLLNGECAMYRLSNFYAANFIEEGAAMGEDVDYFVLPGSEENPDITLSGGIYAAAFNDNEATAALLQYIASTDFANARADNEQGGFLSPNKNVDTGLYPDELTQRFGEDLASAEPVRFDASDTLSRETNSAFWTAVNNISGGDQTVEEALTEVENAWVD